MRAISSFNREAGMSTFWCRAWSAFRTRVSISATGSVNLIVCFSSRRPFAPRPAENLKNLATSTYISQCRPERRVFRREGSMHLAHTRDYLTGRLRNPRYLPAQRQLPETQPAYPKLPQEPPWTPAELAAVMLARGKLGLANLILVQPNSVFNSFCCSRHSILCENLKLETHARNGIPMCFSRDRA